MSIGRIEMVDGVKKNVVYATLGGTGGIQVGNVQDLSIEENADNLTLKWKDPDNVVFNGETIAEWGGTKVVRKEGSSPESVTDGTLVVDSTVKDQYAVEGLQDTDVVEDSQYNYALFPYTTKNVYTMSDKNRVNGMLAEYPYDKILANNTWSEISEASQMGIAKNIWKLGDAKDGFKIIGFDHDDLTDGSGKAGITFCMDSLEWTPTDALDSRTGTAYYTYVQMVNLASWINTVKGLMDAEMVKYVKKVDKKYYANASLDSTLTTNCELFLMSAYEITGTINAILGEQYEYFIDNVDGQKWVNTYWTRDIRDNGRVICYRYDGGLTFNNRYQTKIPPRFSCCI